MVFFFSNLAEESKQCLQIRTATTFSKIESFESILHPWNEVTFLCSGNDKLINQLEQRWRRTHENQLGFFPSV